MLVHIFLLVYFDGNRVFDLSETSHPSLYPRKRLTILASVQEKDVQISAAFDQAGTFSLKVPLC